MTKTFPIRYGKDWLRFSWFNRDVGLGIRFRTGQSISHALYIDIQIGPLLVQYGYWGGQ